MNHNLFNVIEITSKTNSTIVKIAKLENKKHRYEEKLFVCHGTKLFKEAANFGAEIKYIVLKNEVSFDAEVIDEIKAQQAKGTVILCVSNSVFDKISEEQAPQGIITVCSFLKESFVFSADVKNDISDEKILLFESVRDPGNVGTIIRNAAAFGIDRLIFSSDCADVYSSKTIRAAMGAIFKVKINVVNDLKETVEMLKKKGKTVLGAALGKNSLVLGKYNLSKNDAVIIGNEGHGISDELLNMCDNTLLIPMCENTESLNAAIATAIIMWEIINK